MNPDRWREVSRVYGAVMERPEPDRLHAVEHLCAHDAELRREVESLLAGGSDVIGEAPVTARPSMLQVLEARVIGSTIGPYRLDTLLGAGGMGEVYRARDTKLNRDVAIKVLPPSFATDADRLARFRREAQVLASLNHPNIAQIYGLEEQDGLNGREGHVGQPLAIVMELVEGPTLADRIVRGRLPLDEALGIARQIADALEAAHELGIIHRDLKPANIKVREDGTVKVLDFGLAKMTEVASPPSQVASLTQSPTITTPAMTAAGMILGTAAYMSPEQAKGKPADKRSDIWAFGCVLYEMLTGARPFGGEDVAETLAEVIKGTPDWRALPSLPPSTRLLIQRCLEKDRRKRIADASTIQLLLSDSVAMSSAAEFEAPSRSTLWPPLLAGALAGAMLLAAGAWLTRTRWMPASAPDAVTRWAIPLDTGQQFTNTGRQVLAISPDGRMLAWQANSQLTLRSLDSRAPRSLTDGTRSVINPVFSPDNQSIVYESAGLLHRVGVRGGTSVAISPPLNGVLLGVNWTDDGIYYAEWKTADLSGPTRIQRLSPTEGTVTTIAESLPGETFFSPSSLPGHRGILVTLAKGDAMTRWEQAQLLVVLPSGERRTVLTGASDGRYLPGGYLLYSSAGSVFAVPFDLDTLSTRGVATPVLEGVARGALATGTTQYAVSATGTVIYLPGPASPGSGANLAAFGLDGTLNLLKAPSDLYEFARVSPDGNSLAVGANSDSGADIWIIDLSGKSDRRRLTQEGRNRFPVWSPDSRRVAFQSVRPNGRGVFWQVADGSGRAEQLTTPEQGVDHLPVTWAPDKDTLIFEQLKSSRWSLWALSISSGRARPLLDEESTSAMTPVFSPDGKWMAYHSQALEGGYMRQDGSGLRDTVWIRRYPIDANRWEVSSEGTSHHPLWVKDGRQLLYIIGAGQWRIRDVTLANVPTFAPPTSFSFAVPTQPGSIEARTFDLLRDGRVASNAGPAGAGLPLSQSIEVVEHWVDELKAKGLGAAR